MVAEEALHSYIAQLDALRASTEVPIQVREESEASTQERRWLASSLGRELQFLLGHTVHHNAIILHSVEDRLVPYAAAKAHAKMLPKAHFIERPGGHMGIISQAENYAATIRSFIKSVESHTNATTDATRGAALQPKLPKTQSIFQMRPLSGLAMESKSEILSKLNTQTERIADWVCIQHSDTPDDRLEQLNAFRAERTIAFKAKRCRLAWIRCVLPTKAFI